MSGEPMIAMRGVYKSFGDKAVLRGIDLEVRRGEVIFIIGTSGVGKSVTIKHLVGLLRVDAGELFFEGERIDQLSESAFFAVRKRLGMVFQSATLFDSMTLDENVALPLRKHQDVRQRDALARAGELLELVGMREHGDRYPAELSGGMRKRAAIARTLTLDPTAILFDEPTTGLDPVSARRIDRLIRRLADREGKTCVVVSHDLESTFSIADRVALMYSGRVYFCGTPDELSSSTDPVVVQFISGQSAGPMETPGF